MSNIQGYLQNIMQAVYGKDVRQSIRDAIETIDSVADTAQNSATASASRATNSEKAAKASETAAKASETNAKTSETAAANSRKAAKASETAAKASETNAKTSETVAANSEEAARVSETAAKASETNAKEKADAARQSADTAAEKAEIATQKAEEIKGESKAAAASATKAQSYAVGGTGSRDGEDTDNAQYYYEQVKRVSQGLNGIIPMGTVAFADLPVSGMENGWMYNISDDFTSDDRFNDGGGIFYGKGNNVIWTSEGKWDVTAGSGVTGIKGNKEKTYRQGNVNLTPEQIGAVAEDGDTSNNTVVFNVASERKNIASGESHATLFGKIAKIFTDLKTVAFSGNYNDLSNKPTIPANTWRGIQNNLTSTSTTDSLAANQGRLLANGSARDSTKLPLSGGTVTGGITFNPGSGGHGWTDYYSNGSNVLSVFGQGSDGFVRSNANCLYLQCKAGSQGIGVQYNTGVAAPLYAASFNQNSSRRVKKNIEDMTETEAKKLLDVEVKSYDYINPDMPDGCFGCIAEDMVKIIPSCVNGDVDCADDDVASIQGIGIDYSKLVPHLIKMVQIQQAQIDAQQEQIDKLAAQLL